MTKAEFDANYRITGKSPRLNSDRNGRTGYGPWMIHLQCASDLETGVLCTNEIFILKKTADARDMSDDEATQIFNGEGWTIGPTRCPSCIARGFNKGNVLQMAGEK